MAHETNSKQPDFQSIADSIRAAAQKPLEIEAEDAPQGSKSPEQPVYKFPNTTLKEASGVHFDPSNPPEDASDITLEPAEIAAIDQSTAERRDALTKKESHRGRNIAVGSTVAALALGAVAYLGLGNSHENSSDPTGPNQQPTPTATATTGHNKAQTKEYKPITAPLDASIDSSIVPLTDHEQSQLQYANWPNNVERSLIANIAPSAVDNFIMPGAYDSLVNRMPNWNGLNAMYQKYNMRGLLEAMGDRSMMGTIYSHDFAGMAGQYGEPQSFASPDTAKLIGSAPVIKISEIEKASKDADFATVWNKIYPDNRDYQGALLSELKAGNTDPALVDRLVSIAMVGNEMQGNLESPMDSQSRDEVESTLKDSLTNLYNAYHKDPKKAESDYKASQPGKVTTNSVNVYDAVRQLPGEDIRAGTDATSTVSDFVVFRTYTVEGSPQGVDDGQYGEMSVISFVAAPTKDSKGQYAMPILLDRTTTKIG